MAVLVIAHPARTGPLSRVDQALGEHVDAYGNLCEVWHYCSASVGQPRTILPLVLGALCETLYQEARDVPEGDDAGSSYLCQRPRFAQRHLRPPQQVQHPNADDRARADNAYPALAVLRGQASRSTAAEVSSDSSTALDDDVTPGGPGYPHSAGHFDHTHVTLQFPNMSAAENDAAIAMTMEGTPQFREEGSVTPPQISPLMPARAAALQYLADLNGIEDEEFSWIREIQEHLHEPAARLARNVAARHLST
ncbi:hypothetical protein PG988_006515 [Apiospora saccharicola]